MNLLSSLLKYTADQIAALRAKNTSQDTTVSGIDTRLGTAETKVTNMEAQLATAISAVTVDSEVQNIRVGDDNVTYTSAGEAVRTQFSKVKADFNYLFDTNRALYFGRTVSGTRGLQIGTDIKSGTYTLSIDNIVSSDTDATTCLISFMSGDDTASTLELNRGVPINQEITLTANITSLIFWASNRAHLSIDDTFTFTNVKVFNEITDKTLTQQGRFADAKATGDKIDDVISDLRYLYGTNKAIYFAETPSGIRQASFRASIPSGTYLFSVDSITSTDTDSTLCLVVFLNGDTSVLTLELSRGVAISQEITLASSVDSITFYASYRAVLSDNDSFTYTNVRITNEITDKTLTYSGRFADSKVVGDRINDTDKTLNHFFDTGTELILGKTVTGTKMDTVNVDMSAGRYSFSVDNVVSSDTDATTCAVVFWNGDTNVLALQFNRGVATSQEFSLDSSVDHIIFYASDRITHADGDTFTFTNVEISKGFLEKYSVPAGRLKVLLMGDSIFGNDGEVASYLNEWCESCVNGAFGGTRVSPRSASDDFSKFDGVNIITALCNQTWTAQDTAATNLSDEYPWITSRLAGLKAVNMSELDLLVMDWGTNDFTGGATLDYIISSYTTVIDLLQETYPELRILITTPIWRYWGVPSDNDNGDTRISEGHTLKEISEGIETLMKNKRISVLNAYQNLPLSYNTADTYFDSGSGTHLNLFGNRVYAHLIFGKICSIY